MEAKRSFGDAIVAEEMNKEAWNQLSREFKWNEELLKKYRAEIDWEALSCNTEMLWTASILDYFKGNIDWKEFSGYAPARLLTPKIIEQFADRWDWHELSENSNLELSYALLDKFADRWDWERIINSWRNEELYTPRIFRALQRVYPRRSVQRFKTLGCTCREAIQCVGRGDYGIAYYPLEDAVVISAASSFYTDTIWHFGKVVLPKITSHLL